MSKQRDERIEQLLKQVVDHCDLEDRASRERQVRTWRRLRLLWEGFSRTWYSETAHDWRIWDEEQAENTDQSYYDKPINIFRAYLESIIAALSVVIPPIKCYPDDADNPLDLMTAKAGDRIAQLIFRHNDVSLLWLHALFVYCTEGLVACYARPVCDEKFGTYEEKEEENVDESTKQLVCPNCGHVLDEQANSETPDNIEVMKERSNEEKDEFGVNDEDAPLQDIIQNKNLELCPSCQEMIDPEIKINNFITTRIIGVTTKPKSRIIMECFGGLNVKIPNWVRKQEETPYLIYAYETHYANAIEKYDHLRDNEKLRKFIDAKAAGAYDQYDQWGRLSPQYQGEYPINVVTMKHCWLRPAIFNILKDEDDIAYLKKHFPNGACVSLVNGEYADSCNEALDDYWTLSYNPLANYLQSDPIGLLLTSIQDITNDLVSLVIQTIEHGIGQTFADPSVLNFTAYSQTETLPGGIYPIKQGSLGNKSINDAFKELRTATLSAEVLPFLQNVQSLGQMVSGALPSLFGGSIEGSKTASQYSMSRAQALQRLQNTWKIFTVWWKQIFGKAIPIFIKEVQEDERDVQQDKDGNFINVFIRKAELEGKIGKIELEANENLPLTWNQVRDSVMQLLQASNPKVLEILSATENLEEIREAIGLTDLYVPGEDDRSKQYDEIKLLLESQPIQNPIDPMQQQQMMQQQQQMVAQQPQEEPSVDIDVNYDNHKIHFEVVRNWVISEVGRNAKIDNENGYRNVVLHGLKHQQEIAKQMMVASQPQGNDNTPFSKPNHLRQQEAPIMGEGNVPTVQ